MLCILAIRLLLAYSLGSDLGGIANPQLEVQFRQQSLEPARMPTGFYPHTHFHSWCCEVTVELFRFLRVRSSPVSVSTNAICWKPGWQSHPIMIIFGSFLPSL